MFWLSLSSDTYKNLDHLIYMIDSFDARTQNPLAVHKDQITLFMLSLGAMMWDIRNMGNSFDPSCRPYGYICAPIAPGTSTGTQMLFLFAVSEYGKINTKLMINIHSNLSDQDFGGVGISVMSEKMSRYYDSLPKRTKFKMGSLYGVRYWSWK